MSKYEVYNADPLIRSHAIHWLACMESYKAQKRALIDSWWLAYADEEICVYKSDLANKVVIAFRGTKVAKDIYDDALLSYGMQFPRVSKAIDFTTKLMGLNPGLVVELTGHSLGGAIARETGKALSLEVVTFNAAAPPSRPVISYDASTDYHIMFDLISAWQSPGTIRIDKGFWPIPSFVTLFPHIWVRHIFDSVLPSHELKNFSNEKVGVQVSAATENNNMKRWFASLPKHVRTPFLVAIMGMSGYYSVSLPDITE